MLFSSTTVLGHTAFINSSFVTRRPAADATTASMSKARDPRWTTPLPCRKVRLSRSIWKRPSSIMSVPDLDKRACYKNDVRADVAQVLAFARNHTSQGVVALLPSYGCLCLSADAACGLLTRHRA